MALDSAVWLTFSADPRAEGALRASDRDRGRVFEILGGAFAEGLLDVDEHAERLEAAGEIKTLAEIVPLLEDLVRPADIPAPGTAPLVRPEIAALDEHDDEIPTTPEGIDATALELYRADLRRMAISSAAPSLLTVAIWLVISIASRELIFFWPAFVILGTGMGVFSTVMAKDSIIKQRKRMLTTRAKAKLGDADAQAEIRANPKAFEYDITGTRAKRRIRRAEIERRRRRGEGPLF
ncbi:hypothetical protein GCM10022261_06330 [Brevibacterium daeguense]|uniref:DUF1707 domain-containing protein n=1 Tax=Brevibacterium daeguense TaxID=909936 RepID=A0ABP8EGL0_9MICO|nr:DUF1707 domain-containing protein [Brevibacterium daeguense]